jgi:uncharacterized protein (UPF0303 family)
MRVNMLSLPREYIFSLMNFTVNNRELFKKKLALHSVNTGNRKYLRRPVVNLSCFQKSAYYSGKKYSTVHHVTVFK